MNENGSVRQIRVHQTAQTDGGEDERNSEKERECGRKTVIFVATAAKIAMRKSKERKRKTIVKRKENGKIFWRKRQKQQQKWQQ